MEVKRRSVPLSIFLTFITLGLYGVYWFTKLTREVSTLVDEKVYRGGFLTLLASIFTGGIWGSYWFFRVPAKLNDLRAEAGLKAQSVSKGIWVLSLLIFAQFASIGAFCSAARDDEWREQFEAINWSSEDGFAAGCILLATLAACAWAGTMFVYLVPILSVLCTLNAKPKMNYAFLFFFGGITAVAILQANLNNYLLYLHRRQKMEQQSVLVQDGGN